MNKTTIQNSVLRFITVKLFVLLLVNTVMFAAAALLLLILRAVTASTDSVTDLFYKSMIVSGVTGAGLLSYMVSSLRRAASTVSNTVVFALKEGAVYSLFVTLPFVLLCTGGLNNLTDNIICRYFLPNLFFVYAVKNVYWGILIEVAVYTLAIFVMAVIVRSRNQKSK